jgi:AAA domain-containing protein
VDPTIREATGVMAVERVGLDDYNAIPSRPAPEDVVAGLHSVDEAGFEHIDPREREEPETHWPDEPSGEEPAAPSGEPFVGLVHAQVLELDFPAQRRLIRDLVPVGAVGTIAGVPETHKSWLAQAIASRVAEGAGVVLGCDVAGSGNVGYFWQDDSTREEAERIKLFHQAHDAPAALPLWWFLNEGLALPDDLERLRATVETLQLDLVVLDSFYNVVPGVDLKDEGPEQIVALLKREIADATGCTVLIVDHMPWATEQNRTRLRAYGGVFKNAATRFGIYIDANGKNLSIEVRGNNISGFKKRPAYWDPDTLELRLADHTDHDEKVEERANAILVLLESDPGLHSKTAIRKAVGGRAQITDQALEALKARDRVKDLSADDGTGSDVQGKARGWIASIHAVSQPPETLSLLDGTAPDSPAAGQTTTTPVPSPIGGQGYVGTGSNDVDEHEIERLAAEAEALLLEGEPG